MARKTFEAAFRSTVACVFAAVGWVATQAATAPPRLESEPAPLASVRVTVPDTDGRWPVRCLVAVPDGEAQAFSVHAPDGTPLPTQAEPHLRGPDGAARTLWVAALAPEGLPAGEEVRFEVRPGVTEAPDATLTPLVRWALVDGGGWTVTVRGIDGGVYQAAFDAPQVLRAGPVEYVWRVTAPLVPVVLEDDPALRLPHLGVATMDVRAWAGVDALDVRLLWETGVVDDPNAWALFESVTLRSPHGAEVRTLEPTRGVGHAWQASTGSLLELVEPGEHGVVSHAARLWSLGLVPPGRWDDVAGILRGGGWGLAADGAWSVHSAPATAAGLALPRPSGDALAASRAVLKRELDDWLSARSAGSPLDGAPAVSSWRQPSGIGYGGATSGQGIDAWPFVDRVVADPAAAYRSLLMHTEARLDRTRLAIVHLDGTTWDPAAAGEPFNLAISPALLYGDSWQTAWPSWGLGLAFRDARPEYREATLERARAVLEVDRQFGTDDLQHFVRGQRGTWPLAELYAEPMARLLVERHSAAVRADLFDGPAAGRYTETLRWMADRKGAGQDFGRDYAWAGWQVALDYALRPPHRRAVLERWLDTWCEVLEDGPAGNGAFLVVRGGKELQHTTDARVAAGLGSSPVYPTQAYQQALVIGAGLQVRGAFAGARLDDPLRRLVGHLAREGWAPAQSAPDYRYAVARPAGDGLEPITGRSAVEAAYASTLHPMPTPDGNTYQTTHIPLALAAEVILGAGAASNAALDRFLGASTRSAQIEAAWRRQGQHPADWWPLLAALEQGRDPK